MNFKILWCERHKLQLQLKYYCRSPHPLPQPFVHSKVLHFTFFVSISLIGFLHNFILHRNLTWIWFGTLHLYFFIKFYSIEYIQRNWLSLSWGRHATFKNFKKTSTFACFLHSNRKKTAETESIKCWTILFESTKEVCE